MNSKLTCDESFYALYPVQQKISICSEFYALKAAVANGDIQDLMRY